MKLLSFLYPEEPHETLIALAEEDETVEIRIAEYRREQTIYRAINRSLDRALKIAFWMWVVFELGTLGVRLLLWLKSYLFP
jgi:hypothetical protein